MRLALGAPVMTIAAAVALGGCSDDSLMASNAYDTDRQAPRETPDYRYAPPAANPDLRDIPPPLDTTTPRPGQAVDPGNPLATPPASPPPIDTPPASAPG